ncbi:MAG: cobaltochelatase subunit CobN [Rhizobiaceae bacterium]
MHVIFRESHGLEETETPTDLGQSPADIVVLSFSDSDLNAFAAGWQRAKKFGEPLPTLRLANIAALKHPLSVDAYAEQTLEGAKAVLIRLIGGVSYWSYGLHQVQLMAEKKGIALAVLPADGRPDPQLSSVSTVPSSTLERLNHLCNEGGAVAAQAALAQLSLAAGIYAKPVPGIKQVPLFGAWDPEIGICEPKFPAGEGPHAVIVFYRAYLTAADTEPVERLFEAFRIRGFDVTGLFAPSLKEPQAASWLEECISVLKPDAIVNATSFSGKGDGGHSPLDIGNVPVFQVALATSSRDAWANAERGLSPADLAMHVVLPEVDGRIFAGVASFKEAGKTDPDLEFACVAHHPDASRVEAIADRVVAWISLARASAAERKLAMVLSTYPGKPWQMAHAVGLDGLASAQSILGDLKETGYSVSDCGSLEKELETRTVEWPLEKYLSALGGLPSVLESKLTTVWGNPEEDPAFNNGNISFQAVRLNNVIVALQPERGHPEFRDDDYHDLSRTPRHGYVAFYLWLREQEKVDALLHIGAHGTLEWLPGKAVALGEECWPEALIGSLPVLYPFIVNDPGEAAQAKRRIGAVTLGHIPPLLKDSGAPERFASLEALLDEFSNADGLDPKRRDRLQSAIRSEAQALGVEADLGLDKATCVAEAITRIDRFVCDIKESQFGDGLHIWGRQPQEQNRFETELSVASERSSIIDALNGKRIVAGPSGSPYRGRNDVLPTGRNLYTTDPRSVPTRAAYSQGVQLAEELVRRHLQEEGDWPKGLVIDLWGSATMRTAGEEFAMALHLLGVKPKWDAGSERVSGIEVLPLAEIDRPRIDVTLRVSGLFRDVFPALSSLFDQAVQSLSSRDECEELNPYVNQKPSARVFGPAPGSYGLGMGSAEEDYSEHGRKAAGEAWLEASSWLLGGSEIVQDKEAIAKRVAAADSFVHLQDLPETDLLLATDYATHEAGFAAAKAVTGGDAVLYHLDNTMPEKPRARTLPEEIARVVRARASNPDWIAGMKRHGFRGAAEIAATLDHMAAFANLADAVKPHLFDLYYTATLGDAEVAAFLEEANPQAFAAMQNRFAALADAGLWETRSNSISAALAGEVA